MKIKGKILQLLKPGDLKKKEIMPMGSQIPIYDFPDNYHLIIAKEDYPNGFFKRFIYRFKNRKEGYCYYVTLKECSYKINDIVELEVEPYLKKTKLLLEKKNG